MASHRHALRAHDEPSESTWLPAFATDATPSWGKSTLRFSRDSDTNGIIANPSYARHLVSTAVYAYIPIVPRKPKTTAVSLSMSAGSMICRSVVNWKQLAIAAL